MKLRYLFSVAVLCVLASFAVVFVYQTLHFSSSYSWFSIAQADDEEEEEDDEDEDEERVTTKTETKKVTTYVKLPDQVVTKKIVTTIYDSDGDGIFDDTDPTPNINDNFIVKDANANGIVDEYEQYGQR